MNWQIGDNKNIIVSTHDPLCPTRGGGALRTLKIAVELKKRGHNLRIIAPADGLSRFNGIELIGLTVPEKQPCQILSVINFNIRLLIKFLKFAGKTDIFFIHNTIAAITLPLLKKIFKFRFFLDITDIHVEYLLAGKMNLFEKLLAHHLLRYEYGIIKSADFITVATNAMKGLLISKGIAHNKIEVVYDSADMENIPQQKEPDAEYGIIHLGAIDSQHGVDLLIQAIPLVVKEFPQARFFFVGGGREVHNIKKLAKKLKIADNCVFTGWLLCQEARNYFRKATIGIIPRRDSLPNRIITTLKIYEYWASKTAVISAPLQGIKEIATNEDILWFDSGDAGDLGRKILSLLRDKELKEKIIEGGLAKVTKFNFEDSTAKIADFVLT
jgi:glycosyltransferase involved in cell wall biosynthesis